MDPLPGFEDVKSLSNINQADKSELHNSLIDLGCFLENGEEKDNNSPIKETQSEFLKEIKKDEENTERLLEAKITINDDVLLKCITNL
jgi:hypothetical protein